MKIGINLLPLRPGKIGGMELYVRNLLMNLASVDLANEYYLITAPYNDSSLQFSTTHFKKIEFTAELTVTQKIKNFGNKIFGKTNCPDTILNKIIDQYHFDVWFCPFSSLEPRPVKIPSLVTIPDIQQEYYPEHFSDAELALREEYTKSSGEMATEIITLSAFSKKCFVEKLGLDPAKIHVVHLSADTMIFDPQRSLTAVIKKYNLPDEYFLYPAHGWPHKNHLALIRGYSLYKTSFNTPQHLVLTGSGLQDMVALKDLIAHNGIQEYVHILGYVETEDLPGLYKNATALVFPSLFEGFGIPLLEAMAMECPIIAANTTSIPEVAGDAAYYFDPKNPRSICDAMHRIVDDPPLRENLVRNGRIRVTDYSYDTVARRHLVLFASACSKAREAGIAYRNRNNVDSINETARHSFQKEG